MDFLYLLHQAACGALAAAGFGVLFNIDFRTLSWCAVSGAVALLVRTTVLQLGWTMEAASFVAALVVGFALQMLPARETVSRDALHVVGCIPMIPGAFAAKAILGLFVITSSTATNDELITAIDNAFHVIFTLGALGVGLAIPNLLVLGRRRKKLGSSGARASGVH